MRIFNLIQFVISMVVFIVGISLLSDHPDKTIGLSVTISGVLYFIHLYGSLMFNYKNRTKENGNS